MRRKGRQHGMVRTHSFSAAPFDPRPYPMIHNELSSRPTAGDFMKVSAKPTNHSKFTGKDGRHHYCRPASTLRGKIKAPHKIRSKISGFSATEVLDYLGSVECEDRDYGNYDDDDDDCGDYDYRVSSTNGVEVEEVDEDDDGMSMSFCEVGFVLEEDDESWCLWKKCDLLL